MNSSMQGTAALTEIGRSSRRAALISLLGFCLAFAAIVYSALQLKKLEHKSEMARMELLKARSQVEKSQNELRQVQADLSKTRASLATARASLAAGRAAINAFHAGRLEEAIQHYDEALRSDPQNAYLQNLRAYSLFRQGNVSAAIEGQRLSLAADPHYAKGYLDLARFLCAASPSDIVAARKAADMAKALNPEIAQIMRNDGEFQRVCHHKIR